MAHVKRQIRERAGVTLTGLSLTGSNVFESRLYALNNSDLPSILVSTDTEEVEVVSSGSGVGGDISRRIVGLNVVIKAKETTDLDDVLDGIQVEIEAAIATDTNNALKRAVLTGSDFEQQAGDKPTGTTTLSYQVEVYTVANDPETIM
tara:strand:+ start:8415 stop:8858 length:444 start_codon:yes stop_codon:yes gene_type:complete